MKTLGAVLALALAAAPAGAQQIRIAPSLPSAMGTPAALPTSLGLPASAIALPAAAMPTSLPTVLQAAGIAPAAVPTHSQFQLYLQTGDKGIGALPSAEPLTQAETLRQTSAPGALGGYQTGKIQFDGAGLKAGAAPAEPVDAGGSALSGVIARIEAEGQVQVDPNTGAAYKGIQPVVEQTENSQTLYAVALKGTVDAAGSFTRQAVIAVRQAQEVSQTAVNETTTRVQEKAAVTAVEADLNGKASKVQFANQDHTDVITTVEYPAETETLGRRFSAELRAAQEKAGVSDVAGLVKHIQENGDFNPFGNPPAIVLQLSQEQGQDGTVASLAAVVELGVKDKKLVPTGLLIVTGSQKGSQNPDGSGNKAHVEQTVYKATLDGTLKGATATTKEHSLDVTQGEKAADDAAQQDFDGIVGKVAAGQQEAGQ